ncbi:MAG TPA: GNAT family N-acetyltransferase [Bryobacteraceae bacterium]|nr:GNAT family N-acetyltransferase [Bryobacteraceae bacterium]
MNDNDTRSRAAEDLSIVVRDSTAGDMPTIQQIYSFYVVNSLATFEESPPSADELLRSRDVILAAGLPHLVATVNHKVAGYAYASSYRLRPAYRYTVEDSVYVLPGLQSKGIGTALLSSLIARCELGAWRQMIAVIGDSANAGSVALHRRLGFEQMGILKAVGFKLGQWVDTVLMQRSLGRGARTRPQIKSG